jgi:hypothetical protein
MCYDGGLEGTATHQWRVWTFDIHAIIQNLEQLNSICIATGPTPTFINWATVSTSIQAQRFAQVGGTVTKMELCTENTYLFKILLVGAYDKKLADSRKTIRRLRRALQRVTTSISDGAADLYS